MQPCACDLDKANIEYEKAEDNIKDIIARGDNPEESYSIPKHDVLLTRAVDDYKEDRKTERTPKSTEYRSVPTEPTYRTRRGRGQAGAIYPARAR